ncbi:MAG TPA: ATP-grasp domain-containing protein [Actinomycetes bacterium]|jgi:biotin carboxylase|nr:ATP-grasp domain-containing protein [Actinomycetes bacterium]
MTGDSRPYVVLLGPHPAHFDQARRLGVGVVLLDTVKNLAADSGRGAARADHVLGTDYTDVERVAQLIQVLCSELDVRGVLALTENGLLPAARMNAILGVRDNPVEVVERVVDKRLMRKWLAADHAFALPAREIDSVQSLREFASEVGLPVVVKPSDGAGSVGVRVLHNAAEVADCEPSRNGARLLAEKYVQGSEFSVEAFSVDGQHLIAAITEKVLAGSAGENGLVEVGHHLPARMDHETQAALRAFVHDFLDRLGLREGLSHTEVILGREGPVIVETHTRNGGDHIADLVLLSTGLDLRDLALHARCGLVRDLPAAPEPTGGAAIHYLTPPPGVVQEISGLDAARYLPGVVEIEVDVGVGDRVRPLRSSFDRVGYVIAVGADTEQACRRCLDAVDSVTIRTRGGDEDQAGVSAAHLS